MGERFTLIRSGPPSACRSCQSRACRTACSSTQRPSGTISPVCSASGMNRSGPSTPCCGWHQRTSASAPCTLPSPRCTSGWYSMKNSPRSRAAGSAVVSPCRVMARASASGSASSKRLPPAALARYIVMSALRSTSAGPRSPAGPSTMPMLPRTVSSRPSMRIGATERVQDAGGELVDLALGVGSGGQRHELVAAEPGHHLAGRGRAGLQPVGDLDEQPVARRVAEAVVDGLEAVEVEVAQPEAGARRRRRERLLQPLEEQRAVGQSGERVVRGLVPQPQIEQPALGGVLHQGQLVLRPAVGVTQQGDREVGPQDGAVGAVERLLDVVVLAFAAHQLLVELPDMGRVLGVGPLGDLPAAHVLLGAAEHPQQGAVDLEHVAVQVGDADAYGGALEHRAEPGLGGVQRLATAPCAPGGRRGRWPPARPASARAAPGRSRRRWRAGGAAQRARPSSAIAVCRRSRAPDRSRRRRACG